MVKLMGNIKFNYLLHSLLCCLSIASSKTAKAAEPDVNEWVEEYESRNPGTEEFRYPEKLVIIQDIRDSGPIFVKIPPKTFNWLGMFEIEDFQKLTFQYRLNLRPHTPRLRLKAEDPDIFRTNAPELFRKLRSDLILFAPKSGNWELYSRLKEEPVLTEQNPPKEKLNATVINSWINSKLGYDGFVVAQKDRYLLIKSQASLMKQGLQALLLRGSEEDVVLIEKKAKGGGLLQALASKGQYGLYKIIVAQDGRTEVAPGTKVILERTK